MGTIAFLIQKNIGIDTEIVTLAVTQVIAQYVIS